MRERDVFNGVRKKSEVEKTASGKGRTEVNKGKRTAGTNKWFLCQLVTSLLRARMSLGVLFCMF